MLRRVSPPSGCYSGNRGRDLGTDVTNIACTLWNGPQEGQKVPTCWGHQSHLRASQGLLAGWWRHSWERKAGAWISPKEGQIQLLVWNAGKDRPGTAGKIIGWKMAISSSNGFQGYEVFWSVLAENKKNPVVLSSSNCQVLSSRSRGFLFSPFSLFLGCNYFIVKMPNYSSFPDYCHWKGASGSYFQLKGS